MKIQCGLFEVEEDFTYIIVIFRNKYALYCVVCTSNKTLRLLLDGFLLKKLKILPFFTRTKYFLIGVDRFAFEVWVTFKLEKASY